MVASIWAAVLSWGAAAYLFVGVWVVFLRVDWESGPRFHLKRFPLAPWTVANMIAATVLQLGLLVLLWPLYERFPPTYYKTKPPR